MPLFKFCIWKYFCYSQSKEETFQRAFSEELFFITRSFYCTYLNNSKKILHKITTIAQKTKHEQKMVGWEQSFKYCTWVPTCVPILHLVPSGIYSLHITNTYNKSIIGKIHKRRVSHWALVFFSINWIAHKISSIFRGNIPKKNAYWTRKIADDWNDARVQNRLVRYLDYDPQCQSFD